MSLNQMKKVFDDQSIKGNKKLIMLALADNANDSGVAFPSWSSLMKKCSMSKGSCSENIKFLEEAGYLFKKNRSRKNGGRSSNKYLIYPNENRGILDEEDYLFFEEFFIKKPIQSSETELGGQSSETELGSSTQSSETELECEQSLISSNHHLKKITKKVDDFETLRSKRKKDMKLRREIQEIKLASPKPSAVVDFTLAHRKSDVELNYDIAYREYLAIGFGQGEMKAKYTAYQNAQQGKSYVAPLHTWLTEYAFNSKKSVGHGKVNTQVIEAKSGVL